MKVVAAVKYLAPGLRALYFVKISCLCRSIEKSALNIYIPATFLSKYLAAPSFVGKNTTFGILIAFIGIQCVFISFSADLLEIAGCTHPTVMKDMCAECGADLREYAFVQLCPPKF